MAVGRMLNRTSALDRELNSVSIEAQLLFVMSIPHLDRDGLIIGEPLPNLGTVLPLRPDFFAKYEQLIGELTDPEKGLVVSYETKKGRVLFFPGFRKNQTLPYGREAASVFDPPPGYIRTATGLAKEDGSEDQNTSPDQLNTSSGVSHEQVMSNSGASHDQNTLKISKDKISQVNDDHDFLDQRDEMVKQYEAVLGMVSTANYPEMIDYMSKLQVRKVTEWWSLALIETTQARRPSWQYMKAVLEGWIAAGKATSAQASPKNGSDPVKPKTVLTRDFVTNEVKEVPA